MKTYRVTETTIEKGFKDDIIDQLSEIDNNKFFFYENLEFKDENKSNKEDWLDENLYNSANSKLNKVTGCQI